MKNNTKFLVTKLTKTCHHHHHHRHQIIKFMIFILFCCYMKIPSLVVGGCREEPKRSCESICSTETTATIEPFYNNNENDGDGDTEVKTKQQYCLLRAGVLLPLSNVYEVSLAKALPALELAENYIRRKKILPSFIRFSWISYDDRCDASYAAVGAMDGYGKDCVHVFFGPTCDFALASVSRMIKYFRSEGTPLISTGGLSFNFQEKKTTCSNEFYMLIRAGLLSFKNITEIIIALMHKFNWTHAVFFAERNGQKNVGGQFTCHLMMSTVAQFFRESNITYSAFMMDSGTGNLTEDMKREVGLDHSIVIMCADPPSIRQIMLVAEELHMIDSGEYVFINIELFSRVPHMVAQPWYDKNDTEENNKRARKAYTALLTVTAEQPDDDEYRAFSEEIKRISAEKYNYTFEKNEPVSTFVTSFYDAVLLYAYALNDSIREDPSVLMKPFNGTDMVRRMWNRSFRGITGNVTIDENGDRISTYSLLDMNPDTGKFEIIAHSLFNHLEYIPGKSIHWAGGRLEPPPDKPFCGYDGSLCPDNSLPGYAILSLVLGFTVIIMAIISFLGYHHYKSEAEINSMTWKVNWNDVLPCDPLAKLGSMHSLAKRGSQVTMYSEDIASLPGDRQIFIPVGFYRGCKVAIKKINESNVNLNRSMMLELKRMKDIQHDHLVRFYGACLDSPKCFLLTEYCPKGSLQDILENDQIKLDWMFKLSLMHDIVRGMHFLHQSDIKSHGNLKSSNCVVDSRFVLKITDFGLHRLRKPNVTDDIENCDSYAYWKRKLWTAPELLRMENPPLDGTQKGDVYSFGIIVHEITTRQGPFYLGEDERSPEEIIQLVKAYPKGLNQPFRPQIDETAYDDINNIMVKCWAEDPYERPEFGYLKATIRRINKDNETGNIVDNLLQRMEQYANNLEGLVEERTRDYLEEKKKCEKLLYQLLPQTVAAQLISGQPVIAETYDQVTIYFSDIVGFTAISAESTPMQVVNFLNDLYTCFDSIVENFDVYKVETIGDAYMVVSGLPIRNGNLHAREIARMALALLDAVYKFTIKHRPNDQLKLRIGLHSGPCVAGVVGLKMPRYCLFGDTVNTASRMESNGEALKIHISQNTKDLLDLFGTFIIQRRGYVKMKGKGEMLTYWLEGENRPQKSTLTAATTNNDSYSSINHLDPLSNNTTHNNSLLMNDDSKTDQEEQPSCTDSRIDISCCDQPITIDSNQMATVFMDNNDDGGGGGFGDHHSNTSSSSLLLLSKNHKNKEQHQLEIIGKESKLNCSNSSISSNNCSSNNTTTTVNNIQSSCCSGSHSHSNHHNSNEKNENINTNCCSNHQHQHQHSQSPHAHHNNSNCSTTDLTTNNKRNSTNLEYNNLVKTNNMKNLKIKCNSSPCDDNVKSVTQPLLANS